MKKLIEFLIDFLRDRNDGSSYKRLTGFASFIIASTLAFMNRDLGVIALFLGVTMGEGVATLFERDRNGDGVIDEKDKI
jgi:hypothetical protein